MPGASRDTSDRGRQFGDAIRAAREAKGWTQDDLIERSGVSRATLLRWESGAARTPDSENVRKVFLALGLDAREAAVLLGYVTREEIALGPEPPRIFNATTEEVIEILEDPNVPEIEKQEWARYLRFRAGRDGQQAQRRRAAG